MVKYGHVLFVFGVKMASNGVNKVILIGRLGRDPEIRYMQGGEAVANIALATSETWRDKSTGEQREKTEWHRVVLFGKVAEIAEKYMLKGAQIYVEGQLKTRKWQNQAGLDQYSTEIVVQGFNGVVQMLSSAKSQADTPQRQQPQQGQQGQQGQQPQHQPAQHQYVAPDFDDDIPF